MKCNFLVGLLFAATLFAASCTNIDELSDDNSIASLTVISHFPNEIKIEAPELDGDVIYIPIVSGQSKFPLRFYASLKITADIDRVVGIDFSQEQCLNSVDDQIKFMVMAKSGLTRTYYIKAKVIYPDDNNYIEDAFIIQDAPADLMISQVGMKSNIGDTLKINVIGDQTVFPLTITPLFTKHADATFRNFENGTTALRFENAGTVQKIKVVSKNGAERIWNIKVVNRPLITGADPNVSEEKRETTNVNPRKFAASISEPGFAVDEYFVDNIKDEIVLTLKEAAAKGRAANVTFPLNVDVKITMPEEVELFKITSTLAFESYNDVKEFYIMDAFEGVSRRWKIRIKEWIGNEADVLAFTYNYSVSNVKTSFTGAENKPSIVLDKDAVEIYPDQATVFIKSTAIAYEYNGPITSPKKWRLTLSDINCTVSKGATVTLPKFEWLSNAVPGIPGLGKQDNNCWKDPKTFIVKGEDGTEKEWTLQIKEPNDTGKSNQAEMDPSSFRVERVVPNYTLLDPKSPWAVDASKKEISIMIAEIADGDYPIQLYTDFQISPYAKVTSQSNNTKPLIFTSETDTQTITIVSQDGTVTNNWTVKLITPIKTNGADVETFNAGFCTPTTFTANSSVINKEDGKVKIFIEGTGALPITISCAMTISPKATIEGGMSLKDAKFTFGGVRESVPFWIIAEDGSRKLWQVSLDYRPELPKGNLDSWEHLNKPTLPWSAPYQNGMVDGTSNEARGNGKAAVLVSKSTIKFAAGSIFLGNFKFDAGIGMTDPISLTYFGIPFQATAKIKGMLVDLCYEEGLDEFDYGSAVIELVDYNDKLSDPSYKNYEYHGLYPTADPVTKSFEPVRRKNNAKGVANGEYFISNSEGNSHRGTAVAVVGRGEWNNDVFVPIKYPNPAVVPAYTHLHIVFSSSGRGARFEGTNGSKLKVDNVRLVYED